MHLGLVSLEETIPLAFFRSLLLHSLSSFTFIISSMDGNGNEKEKLRLQLSSLVWGLVIGSGQIIGRAMQGSAISFIIETTYFWSATFLIFTSGRNFECIKY